MKRLGPAQARAFAYIEANPDCCMADVGRALGYRNAHGVRALVDALEAKGLVTCRVAGVKNALRAIATSATPDALPSRSTPDVG
jgi:hypothetical protein